MRISSRSKNKWFNYTSPSVFVISIQNPQEKVVLNIPDSSRFSGETRSIICYPPLFYRSSLPYTKDFWQSTEMCDISFNRMRDMTLVVWIRYIKHSNVSCHTCKRVTSPVSSVWALSSYPLLPSTPFDWSGESPDLVRSNNSKSCPPPHFPPPPPLS